MARPIRVEFEGALYHVTARGNERRRTYRDDEDRRRFLATLEQTIQQHGLRLHGFCLMPNHYHLLVETPRANLSRAIGWLQTTYTIRFNRRHRRSGHLFQGRFKAHVVDADGYAMVLLRYVHLNPVRPKDKSAAVPMERRAELEQYPWSSHRCYCGIGATPAWLCTDWLSFFGRSRTTGRREYRRFVDDAFRQSLENPWRGLHRGLVLGGEKLLERVNGLLDGKAGIEEIAWVTAQEDEELRQAVANDMARQEGERGWKAWVRVCLGGERRAEVARSLGYRDGSAITQMLKRLDERLPNEPRLRERISALREKFHTAVSTVKS